MDVSFAHFMAQVVSSPPLALTTLLTLGVIFVNGWTDAPNAIATCVTTRCMPVKPAIVMSAVLNFAGVLVMTHLNASVAATISNMVDFGTDTQAALIALCAALFSIVVYSVAASVFGIPTSESHSLIAGLTGAAIAIQGGMDGVNASEWVKVIYGLVMSLLLGFAIGWLTCKLVTLLFAGADRRRSDGFFRYAQIAAAAAMSFMHGAQDGQKFMSTAMLAIALTVGKSVGDMGGFPLWLEVLCAGVMAIGTAIGGKKIIKKVGMEMVQLDKYQGFSASVSATVSLFIATVTGLPVSTTHTKTAAIMGAGAAKDPRSVNWGVCKEMVLTWIFTFPGCGLIGFVLAKLFLVIF